LAKAAARNQAMPPDVFFEIIKDSFIKETKPKIMNIVETHDWRAEIMAYLRVTMNHKMNWRRKD
jgi:hypothetical protein